MKKSLLLFISVLLTTLQLYAGEVSQATKAKFLNVGSDKQLFIDDLFFDSSQNINLKINPTQKTGEKNVQRDKPWESATLNWFNVMQDEGKYRMWYECYDIDSWDCVGCDTSFCYAESKDGITWNKPSLGLVEFEGSKDNNILFRLVGPDGAHSRVHGTGIFKDPSAPPEERYKGVGQGLWWDKKPPYRIAGMYSPDGIHWTRYSKPIIDEFADSQYSGFWDSSIKKYVIFGRANQWSRGRSLGRSESRDFSSFEPLTLVLNTNDNDPPKSDLYNSAALKYPYAANAYFMFISLFQHDPQTLDIRLAVSRDGVNWTRPDQNTPFILLGKKGSYDGGSLYMGQGIIRIGDELWQYYGGSRLNHAEGGLKFLVKPGNSRSYSRVISRLDGYVSAEAGPEGGYFVTSPMIFNGNNLELNVKVRSGGSVKVALLDENSKPLVGYFASKCVPITGDHIAKTVKWQSGSDVSRRSGKPTRMRIEMKDASLYAFQFAPGKANK